MKYYTHVLCPYRCGSKVVSSIELAANFSWQYPASIWKHSSPKATFTFRANSANALAKSLISCGRSWKRIDWSPVVSTVATLPNHPPGTSTQHPTLFCSTCHLSEGKSIRSSGIMTLLKFKTSKANASKHWAFGPVQQPPDLNWSILEGRNPCPPTHPRNYASCSNSHNNCIAVTGGAAIELPPCNHQPNN